MKEIQIFNNPQFGEIRVTINEIGEPLFCLADVCKAVGLTNASSVKSRLDKEDTQILDLHALNLAEGMVGNTRANFVTESGFYDVLLYSDAPQVKPFRKWVTREVLPSIRKNGGYIAPMPDETPEQTIFRALSYSQETMERQAEEIRLLKELNAERQRTIELQQLVIDERKSRPQLSAPTTSPASYNSTRIGLELGMTAHELNVALHDAGVIVKDGPDWHLTDAYKGMGLMRPATIAPNRKPGQVVREVWTEKGREFIINLINQSK